MNCKSSKYIKAVLASYYRYTKQHYIVTTEVGGFSADFIAIKDDKEFTEVEIKVSKADFNNDFRKPKHLKYQSGSTARWTPNKFYFAVPESMMEYALVKLIGLPYGLILIAETTHKRKTTEISKMWLRNVMRDYGDEDKALEAICEKRHFDNPKKIGYTELGDTIVEYDEYLAWKERIKIVKPAKILHQRPVHPEVKRIAIARLTSEVTRMRLDEFNES